VRLQWPLHGLRPWPTTDSFRFDELRFSGCGVSGQTRPKAEGPREERIVKAQEGAFSDDAAAMGLGSAEGEDVRKSFLHSYTGTTQISSQPDTFRHNFGIFAALWIGG
jgi:hypothetical protein